MFSNKELDFILDSITLEMNDLENEGETNCRRYKILDRLHQKVENRMSEKPFKEETICYYCFTELAKTDPGPGIDVTGCCDRPKVTTTAE